MFHSFFGFFMYMFLLTLGDEWIKSPGTFALQS